MHFSEACCLGVFACQVLCDSQVSSQGGVEPDLGLSLLLTCFDMLRCCGLGSFCALTNVSCNHHKEA